MVYSSYTRLEGELTQAELRLQLAELDRAIEEKQQARQLLAALAGETDMKSWHLELDKVAPDAHRQWLIKQGFSEQQALHLKWLSRDMNTHEQYMADFMRIFSQVERWGPGSEQDTLQAIHYLPKSAKNLLEIGCGKGTSTRLIASNHSAHITAVDNEPTAVEAMNNSIAAVGLQHSVTGIVASMTELPFNDGQFDAIWAEGCAYIMGVEQALSNWRRLLSDDGILILSDLVWLTEQRSAEAVEFWLNEYPDMQSIATRMSQFAEAGYQVIDHFNLSEQAWRNYHEPLSEQIQLLQNELSDSAALADLKREIDIYLNYLGEFGYTVFIAKPATHIS